MLAWQLFNYLISLKVYFISSKKKKKESLIVLLFNYNNPGVCTRAENTINKNERSVLECSIQKCLCVSSSTPLNTPKQMTKQTHRLKTFKLREGGINVFPTGLRRGSEACAVCHTH